jgi:hypothetical protein
VRQGRIDRRTTNVQKPLPRIVAMLDHRPGRCHRGVGERDRKAWERHIVARKQRERAIDRPPERLRQRSPHDIQRKYLLGWYYSRKHTARHCRVRGIDPRAGDDRLQGFEPQRAECAIADQIDDEAR